MVPYLTDASNMPGGHAEKLFVPENEGEIVEILREANEKRIPVTVSGARTGTVGGAVPFGGWVISLEKLNRIESIDKDKDASFSTDEEEGLVDIVIKLNALNSGAQSGQAHLNRR